MAANIPVWGLDVGQSALKAMKLQQAGDHIQLLAFDYVDHETILAKAESDAIAMMVKSIETFVSRNDLRGCRVVLSVPGQQTLTRFTKMPPVEAKKIPDMVQYEASQQIPFDMDEVVWDYQVFTEKDSPDVDVGIFAIRKELIRNHLSHFVERGIEPVIVQASPMASYNAARFEGLADEGKATILLDMGALATDLIVMEGNRIWSRPVPIGGNRFTEALMAAFNIPFRKAEKLKRNAATHKHARLIFNAMRSVLADLVSEIQRSIGFYTSTHREAHITRVVGMGNAFKLPNLQKFLQQNLQIPVERFGAFNKIGPLSGGAAPPAFTENIMGLTVAYGLAIQGLGHAAVESSLLPVEITKSLLWRKKRPWFAATAACLAAGAVAMWAGNVMASRQLSSGLGPLGENIAPLRAPNPADAERILSAPSGDAPVERAARVAGAAQTLQNALSETEQLRKGDIGMLRKIAKLPENNVYIPRILDLIYRACDKTREESERAVTSGREYLQTIKGRPRSERREFWIERLEVLYHPSDPLSLFGSISEPGAAKAGWAVQIIGGTTDPRPAKWIEEQLIAHLDRLGKQPQRGIFVGFAKLVRVTTKTAPKAQPTDLGPGGSRSDGGRSGRGTAPPTRGGGGSPLSFGGGGRGGGGSMLSFGGGGGAGAAGASSDVDEQIRRLKEELIKQDPLTGEPDKDDQRFILHLVVHKGNTPANLIPEEFKPKKEEAANPPDGVRQE
jgi:type IV pilus assembly protein PilM